MKDDICLLSDEFNKEISDAIIEENLVKELEKKFGNAMSLLASNNKTRIAKINKIRLDKIKEIEDEYDKSNVELEKLRKEEKNLLNNYLSKNGKSIKEIHNQILQITTYIEYLYFLREKLCELFGHDAEIIDLGHEHFECKCCGKYIGYSEYSESHYHSKILNIIGYYYGSIPNQGYTLSSLEELGLLLPTFESYQKSLELEQKKVENQTTKNNAKKLLKK